MEKDEGYTTIKEANYLAQQKQNLRDISNNTRYINSKDKEVSYNMINFDKNNEKSHDYSAKIARESASKKKSKAKEKVSNFITNNNMNLSGIINQHQPINIGKAY